MAQNPAYHESARIKLLLVSVAIIIIGLTFVVIPVQATTTDASVPNLVITSNTTFNLGSAQSGYVVNAYISAVGTYRLIITDVDALGNDYPLFSTYVSNSAFSTPPIPVSLPGTIQVQLTSFGGSSATVDASIQHSTTSYPLQIPGLVLLVAGAALILTRVYRIKLSVSTPTPVQ